VTEKGTAGAWGGRGVVWGGGWGVQPVAVVSGRCKRKGKWDQRGKMAGGKKGRLHRRWWQRGDQGAGRKQSANRPRFIRCRTGTIRRAKGKTSQLDAGQEKRGKRARIEKGKATRCRRGNVPVRGKAPKRDSLEG